MIVSINKIKDKGHLIFEFKTATGTKHSDYVVYEYYCDTDRSTEDRLISDYYFNNIRITEEDFKSIMLDQYVKLFWNQEAITGDIKINIRQHIIDQTSSVYYADISVRGI